MHGAVSEEHFSEAFDGKVAPVFFVDPAMSEGVSRIVGARLAMVGARLAIVVLQDRLTEFHRGLQSVIDTLLVDLEEVVFEAVSLS